MILQMFRYVSSFLHMTFFISLSKFSSTGWTEALSSFESFCNTCYLEYLMQ